MTKCLRWTLVPGVVAVAIAAASTATAEPADPNYLDRIPPVVSGGSVPTMNGVPCVGGHYGTCTAFAQNQPPRGKPRTSVGHSPTVTSR